MIYTPVNTRGVVFFSESGAGGPVPGFSAASVCVWQQRSVKAVGNRNTMADTLSLTQVTLSYNSNLTTTSLSCRLPVMPGDISAVLLSPGRQKCELTSTLVPLFWKFSPAVTGKSFCLISLGTA